MDYSRKVIFSIFAIAILGSVSLAYAVPDIWTAATTTNVGSTSMTGVSMGDADNGVAVGPSGTIVFTTNAGVDWTNATTTNVGSTALLHVSMSDASNGVAVGFSGTIVFTTNGGVDWTNATTTNVGSTTMFGVSMGDADNGVAVGPSGTIVFTTNGAVDWTNATTTNVGSTFMRGVSMSDASNGVAVGNSGTIVFTTNGGVDWTAATTTNAGFNGMNSVSMGDASNGVTVGSSGTILFTTNAGVDWTAATTTNVGVTTMNEVSMGDASNGVAVGDSGTIVFTTNGGVDWTVPTTTNVGSTLMASVSMSDADNGVAVGNGGTIVFTASSSSGGGSDQQWKTKPTFGLDHNTFRPLVDGGFSFNGVSHDITDNWWTPFAEQKVKIGTINSFTAKAYAQNNVRVQEFLFGIPNVGDAHKAELGIEVVYDYSGDVEKINVVQKTDIIDADSINVIHSKSKCQSDDTVKRCDTTRLSMKFLEPLQDKIMAIKAIDFKSRVHITYLNEGFDISGNSLNPMITMMIAGTEKSEGLVEVTQTAKYSSIWTTQDGREFEMNTSGSFAQINQSFERHIDTGVMKNRLHSGFADYKETQADNAITQLLEYCPTCLTSFADFKDSWAYEYPEKVDRLEILSYLMIIEERKAIKVLDDAQFSIAHPKAEIDRDDRPISIILAEERLMKKILADERAYLKQILAPQQ